MEHQILQSYQLEGVIAGFGLGMQLETRTEATTVIERNVGGEKEMKTTTKWWLVGRRCDAFSHTNGMKTGKCKEKKQG
ncbi:hypothetical protein TSUD_243040 [Trifolium subterraneum]|uniref:Uncharacterized protein n=1 Tax=Trifolium subterraneum TaxID=3900 RepID=A0A2Z6NYJ7_TRISU|nr:hypothetical protein TSUD_243040 [Trifolium subterraneum]